MQYCIALFFHLYDRSLYQPMLQTIIIDPVLCSMPAHFVGNRLQRFRGISHCDAGSDHLQHIDIIIAIPKSDRLLRFQPVIFQHALDSCSFPAICRDNVYCTVPPCRNLRMVHIFHYQRIFPLTAPQHDLINVLLKHVFISMETYPLH